MVVSYVVGVLNSYFWNRLWTFENKKTNLKNFIKFIFVYITTFIINLLMMFILIDIGGFGVLMSQVFSLSFVSVVSFTAHKYWSFGIEETKNAVCIDK